MPATFTLSAFGDEIDADLVTQLDVLVSEDVFHLELRSAWGQNILDLDQEHMLRARSLLEGYGVRISAIGSPIGKSELARPREYELRRLEQAITLAECFDTRLIRVFSFYVPADQADEQRDEVLARLAALAQRAEQAGVVLLHENERGIYGETPERCHDLVASVGSPALRLAFDPANFVQAGVAPFERAWPLLADYVDHIHIKDAVFADGSVRPAGAGDGAIPQLLGALAAREYQGFLTLEPHLKVAGPSGGESGEDGMRLAIHALRELLAPLNERAAVC